MRILDAAAMRGVDQAAIENVGIPSLVLMENAAIGLMDAIADRYPEAGSLAIFCGPGNNGGDGLALARHAVIRGYHVEIHLFTGGKPLRGDASIQLEICRNQGLLVEELRPEDPVLEAVASARGLDLAVDALFGTGLGRPLSGHFAEVVAALNLLPVGRVAVDIPSGLSGSSAEILGPHVRAELTVTFGAPKIPHVFLPAAEVVGDVVVADLGIPRELIEQAAGDLHLLVEEELQQWTLPRPLVSHKGDYGHAVLLAGAKGKAGAAVLAARATVRSGAGLVTVAAPSSIVSSLEVGSVESMTLPLQEVEGEGLTAMNLDRLLAFAADKQVLTLGPGLGSHPSTVELIRSLVGRSPLPLVLDADGINAYAGDVEALAAVERAKILTPHPGELARLLSTTASEIQAHRVESVREAAKRSQSIVVLKGAQSLIADPEQGVFVNPTGNPGMATGGTGDVLTGVITGLVSQGYDPLSAACLGVFLHGSAGDIAAEELGEASLSASDVLDRLPAAWLRIQA